VFSDASELGYGAAGYLRVNYMDGSIACTLIMGKSRVAPKKVTTLPRLELVAALLASKLLHHLLSELRMTLDGIFMWCDSMIVLRYLSNRTSRFATFVANRVRLINQLTNGLPWHHVPSEHNPTDVASRGSRKASSKEMTSWLRGPAFLMLPPNEWPSTVIDTQLSEEDPEVRNMAVEASERASDFITERLAPRYSSWIRLIKGVSWLRRFVKFVLHKFRHGSEPVPRGRLSVTEMKDAERIVITATQRVAFYSIIAKLKNGVQLNNRKFTDIYRLAPVLLDDALYLGGRVSLRSGLRLLLLPSKSYVTDLIIRHHHVSEGHVGASHVLAAVRKRFWIVKGMASVRRVLHSCIQCKLLYPKPCEQIMAALPPFRISGGGYPFRTSGVDYFGPFCVKLGRSELKRYGCIFTCLQTRAVHLEVTHSMSTDSFVMALIRFISRRGAPEVIFSDNGTNFVGADRELRNKFRDIDFNCISNEMVCRRIEWRFNPPLASHRGGVWERMIRSTRRILTAITRLQVVNDETLSTYLTEVERIINDRPLVPVYDDPTCPEVLRPNDLLLLRSNPGLVNDDVPMLERYTRG
jgi:hypothetical protein